MTERMDRDRARLRRELDRGDTVGGTNTPDAGGLGGLEITCGGEAYPGWPDR